MEQNEPINLKHEQPKEFIEAIEKIALAQTPQSPVVWLQIYCSVINCDNITTSDAEIIADTGLRAYNKRFGDQS